MKVHKGGIGLKWLMDTIKGKMEDEATAEKVNPHLFNKCKPDKVLQTADLVIGFSEQT